MRNEKSKPKGASAPTPDEAMAATNGVDITEMVLSVTTFRLTELFEAPEIARSVLRGMMEAAQSKPEGETSALVIFDEFQEMAKTDKGQPQ